MRYRKFRKAKPKMFLSEEQFKQNQPGVRLGKEFVNARVLPKLTELASPLALRG